MSGAGLANWGGIGQIKKIFLRMSDLYFLSLARNPLPSTGDNHPPPTHLCRIWTDCKGLEMTWSGAPYSISSSTSLWCLILILLSSEMLMPQAIQTRGRRLREAMTRAWRNAEEFAFVCRGERDHERLGKLCIYICNFGQTMHLHISIFVIHHPGPSLRV